MKIMKTLKSALFALIACVFVSCSSLDLAPRDKAASSSWFQTAEQFELNLNALLHHTYWPMERNEWTSGEQTELDMLTDDATNRSTLGRYNTDGVDGAYPLSVVMWDISYTGINRCNKIISEIKKLEGEMDAERYNRIVANARFYRACFYARLMVHFGDVVVVDEDMDMNSEQGREASYELTRSDVWKVLDYVFEEFDEIAPLLPVSYSGAEIERATRGAAYGMKARYALHFASIRKWDTFGLADAAEAERLYEIAAEAALNCMDLNEYELHTDFGELFRMSTKHSAEGIFTIPRSKAMSNNSKYQYLAGGATTAKLPRLSGAPTCTTCCPSWDLLCAFLDDEGKPIDESDVYNPNKPFEHRDPRLTYTIVEHGTQHVGVIYDPHFDVTEVYSSREATNVTNNDSRTYRIAGTSNQYASYNGLVLKKHVDNDWLSPFEAENDKLILRYADVLMMYAEAKIELGDIDATVLSAMNKVRARAYGVAETATSDYPAITETDQAKLRSILRMERRMEFAFENLRLYDLWRWRIADKVLNFPNLGLPKKDEKLQRAYIDNGMWFHGAVPQIDENGCPDFTIDVARGEENFFRNDIYAMKLSQRKLVVPKSYLWPIPTTTMQVMKNITENNQGY
jgi:hypothetical protein